MPNMIFLAPDIPTAVKELKKERGISTPFSCRNDEIFWHDNDGNIIPNPTDITDEQILAKRNEIQAEYDAQDYARKREEEYPKIGDQLDKIYHEGIDAWKADMITPIKNKYPKP